MADKKGGGGGGGGGGGEPLILQRPISAEEAAKKQLSAISGRLQKAPDKFMPGSENEWVNDDQGCHCIIL